MRKKIVSIDLWGTLYKSSPIFSKEVYTHLKGYGFLENVNYEVFLEKKTKVKNHLNYIIEATGIQFNTLDIFTILGKELDEEPIKILNSYRAIASLIHPVLIKNFYKELLEKLSKKYDLVISSNTMMIEGKFLVKAMEKDGIDKYFTSFNFSDDKGFAKPFKGMYMIGNNMSSFHIGDTKSTDYDGPKQHGVIPFIITPTNTFQDIVETLLMFKSNSKNGKKPLFSDTSF